MCFPINCTLGIHLILLYLQVAVNFIPPLLDAVLLDYQRNVPAAREPEVLSTMASIVNRLEVGRNLFSSQ